MRLVRSSVRRLLQFRRQKHLSQAGEAGILEEIFRRLGIAQGGVIVELGASDGLFLSNTHQFVGKGHRLVYIESDAEEFQKLAQNFDASGDVTTVRRHVTAVGPDSLDAILSEVELPADFDLLVLDIDSYDLAVLRSMRAFTPKIVMIEYNPFFLPDEEFEAISDAVHPERGGKGSSLLAIYRAASAKGYSIVCTLNMNAVFVRNDLAALVHERPVSLEESATFEFLPVARLAPRRLMQRAYYLGVRRVLHSLAIRAGLTPTFQYESRRRTSPADRA